MAVANTFRDFMQRHTYEASKEYCLLGEILFSLQILSDDLYLINEDDRTMDRAVKIAIWRYTHGESEK